MFVGKQSMKDGGWRMEDGGWVAGVDNGVGVCGWL